MSFDPQKLEHLLLAKKERHNALTSSELPQRKSHMEAAAQIVAELQNQALENVEEHLRGEAFKKTVMLALTVAARKQHLEPDSASPDVIFSACASLLLIQFRRFVEHCEMKVSDLAQEYACLSGTVTELERDIHELETLLHEEQFSATVTNPG